MSEIQRQTSELRTLAGRINEHHRKVEEALKAGLSRAVEAGELLIEAKGNVGHGEWGAWLSENFEGSERTAQAYMKVARNREALETKSATVADLTFRDALKELTAPKDGLGEPTSEALKSRPFLWDEVPSMEWVRGGMEAAEALIEIRDRGLYKERAETFEDYLRDRFEACLEDFERWEWFVKLPESERAGWLRELAIYEYALVPEKRTETGGQAQRQWSEAIDELETVVRPLDIPPSRERSSLANSLTYAQMHVPLSELVEQGVLGGSA